MNREVKKSHAFGIVVVAITLLLVISIFPLRLWNIIHTEVGGGQENGSTQGIDSTHDVIQDFVAQYDRIDSVSVYVCELTKGRDMHITFWDVDKWKVMYEEVIDLGVKDLPGYVEIPLGLDLEVGGNYRIIFSVCGATYVLGTESAEDCTNPAIGAFYYQDSLVEGNHILAKYNYSVPISKQLSLILIVIVLVAGCLVAGIIRILLKRASAQYITVMKVCQYILNPVAVIVYFILAVMVFPLKLFDNRGSDIFFYEIGLFMAFLTVLYVINHERKENGLNYFKVASSIESLSLYEKIMSFIQMILIALALVYSPQYRDDLYDIFHSISERQMVLCLLLITVCFQSRKELISIQNILITILGSSAGYFYYQKNVLPDTEKEYDLHNLILKLGIVIAIVSVMLAADFIRYLIKLFAQKAIRSSASITVYGILVVVFWACIIILRNTRWWGVVLALVFAVMYVRMNISSRVASWNLVATGGLVLNAIYTIGYCLMFRYFTGFVMGRYSMQFHTVTVTAEYLTIMQVMAAALLIAKISSTGKGNDFKVLLSYIWKELLFFGIVSSYMIFTLSRTGYLAAAVTIIMCIALVSVGSQKKFISITVKSVVLCMIAVIIALPMTFTLQRIVPVMVGHPVFFEVEDASPSTRGGRDWNDAKYMSIERFYSLFRQKILGESSIDYYYIEDPYNYDENGNYLYDDDGNLLSSRGSYGINESHSDKILSSNMGVEKLIASSSDGIFVAEAAVDYDSVIESENSENSDMENDESEDDYSNGRIDIWKTYIKELNMTGHDEMGAVAEDGEVLAHAHNVYLQVAYDHGIIVGILFGLLIVAGIAFSGVYYFRNKESFGALVPFSVITGFAIAGLTEWNFQLCNPMTVAFMLCLPAIIFKVRKEQ